MTTLIYCNLIIYDLRRYFLDDPDDGKDREISLGFGMIASS